MGRTLATLSTGLSGLAEETAGLVERLRASVVVVRDGGRGAGSGVIWQEGGVIVTNNHVAPGRQAQVLLADGRTFTATVRVGDPALDLAILDIPARGLPAATIGDASQLRVGELVFAVGNPLGLPGAVTVGIVSAMPRRDPGGRRGRMMVEADVSLAPGNSGGLLATATGAVVGINAMVRAPGLALAVPSNLVAELLARDRSDRAYLGLSLFETRLPRSWSGAANATTGFVVTDVTTGSPAERAGLMLGDVILGLNGNALVSSAALEQALAALQPGSAVELDLRRGGAPSRLTILAGQALDEAA